MSPRCCECGDTAESEEELRVHITVNHVRYIPLECHSCRHVFLPTLHSLTKHYSTVHSSELPVAMAILSYDAEKAAEVERLLAKSQMSSADEPLTKKKRQQPQEPSANNEPKLAEEPSNPIANVNIIKAEQPFEIQLQNEHLSTSEFDQTPESTDQSASQESDRSEDSQQLMSGIVEKMEPLNEIENYATPAMPPSLTLATASNGSFDEHQLQICQLCQKPVAVTDKDQHILDYHVRTQRYECALCDYKAAYTDRIKTHMWAKHPSNRDDYLDRIDELQDEYKENSERAFGAIGERRSTQRTGPKPISKDCHLCGKTGIKKSERRSEHIWSEHMPINRFGCRLCPQIRVSRPERIQSHVSRYHQGDMGVVEDAKFELQEQFNATRLKAFPIQTTDGLVEEQNASRTTTSSNDSLPSLSLAVNTSGSKRGPRCCNLCSMSVAEKSKVQHIWGNHMQAQRYACALCDFKSAYTGRIKAHMCTKHPSNRDAYFDRVEELDSEYKKMTLLAFGDTSPPGSPITPGTPPASRKRSPKETPPKRQVQTISQTCALCSKTPIRSEVARTTHLWRVHMPTERFSCKLCPKLKSSRTDYVKTHVSRFHAGDMSVVVDAKVALQNQYTTVRRQAFPVALGEPQALTPPFPPLMTPPSSGKRTTPKTPPSPKNGRKKLSNDCTICSKTFKTSETKAKHIWKEHMPTDRFGCRVCPQIHVGWMSTIQRHAVKHHGGHLDVVEDGRVEKFEEFKAMRLKAFPVVEE